MMTPSFAARSAVVLLFVALLTGGCDRPSSGTGGESLRLEDVDGQQLFVRKCAHCHGARGGGDGPGSRSYAKVANLRSPDVQERLSNEQIASIIGDGFGAMPPVRGLHPVEVTALVDYVRTLSRGQSSP